MCCVSLVMCRALSFQRLVLSGYGLPGREARRRELQRNERERGGWWKRGIERFTCENSGGFVMAIV